MNRKGAFLISRELFDNPIWTDVVKFRIFFFIVGSAVFSEKGIELGGVHVGRGQFLRSYRNLADDLQYVENRKVKKYPVSSISRKVESLVKENRLKIEDTELGTLFTVVNYDLYQGLNNYKNENLEQRWNSAGTEQEQNRNNNKNVNNVINDFSSSSENEFAEIMKFYQNNLQRGITESPYNLELISQWFDEFGSDLLLAAMKVSAKSEAKGVNFVEGVLKNWKEAGVKTIEDARIHEKEFKSGNKQYKNNVVQIPNYGGESNGKGNGQHTKKGGNVQLFK